MTRYRFAATIDLADLASVIAAVVEPAKERDFDPELSLNVMPDHPVPPSPADLTHALHPNQFARKTRAKGNGEWPAHGSSYQVVLTSIESGYKNASDLKNVLVQNGFKEGSLNSVLVRLLEKGKVRKLDDGLYALA